MAGDVLRYLAITDGPNGVELISADGACHFPGDPIRDLADSIGAGDFFAAGLIDGLARGLSTPDATGQRPVRRANRSSSTARRILRGNDLTFAIILLCLPPWRPELTRWHDLTNKRFGRSCRKTYRREFPYSGSIRRGSPCRGVNGRFVQNRTTKGVPCPVPGSAVALSVARPTYRVSAQACPRRR